MAAGRPAQKSLAIWGAAYLLSLPFQAVWDLPYVGSKVQPPELVFLAGLLILFRQLWKTVELHRVEKALLLLPVAMLVSFVANPGLSPLLEALGLVYLYGVFLLFRALARCSEWLEPAFTALSCCLIGLSVASFIIAIAGADPEGFWSEWKWLPFLGYLPRISGTAPSSNLWASLLSFAGYFHWVHLRREKGGSWRYLLLAGLSLSYILTLSKSVLFATGVLMLWGTKSGKYKKAVRACGGIAIVVGVTLTHVLPVPSENRPEAISYLPASDCLTFNGLSFCPTTYFLLKQKAVEAIPKHFWFGMGGGNFQKWLEQEQEAGRYPSEMPAYDPHSTYFGLTAEAGLVGLLALAYLIFTLLALKPPKNWLSMSAGLYIALIAIEALSMDVLNFRALWVSLGIFVGVQTLYEKSRTA